MNTTVKQNEVKQQDMLKPQFSNLTEQELRLKISRKEELMNRLESKMGKIQEDFSRLEKVKEEFDVLIKQSAVPFRLINTIWFNRPDSIFFSVKAS